MTIRHETHSEDETIVCGEEFSRKLRPGDIVALCGELGSGKTRFVQGVCRGLGVSEHVTSPTFTILNEYCVNGTPIYHFDFYRMKTLQELREIGFKEYVNSVEGICLIEWAERVKELLPTKRYDVYLNLGKDDRTREIQIITREGVMA